MANEPRGLHIGLADFADPTLLLIGESADFSGLAEQFASGEGFTLQSTLARSPVSLHLIPTEQEGRLTRQSDAFEWHITPAEAQAVAGQLKELAAAGKPVHAYLDPKVNSTGVQIVASFGEYDPDEIFG